MAGPGGGGGVARAGWILETFEGVTAGFPGGLTAERQTGREGGREEQGEKTERGVSP